MSRRLAQGFTADDADTVLANIDGRLAITLGGPEATVTTPTCRATT